MLSQHWTLLTLILPIQRCLFFLPIYYVLFFCFSFILYHYTLFVCGVITGTVASLVYSRGKTHCTTPLFYKCLCMSEPVFIHFDFFILGFLAVSCFYMHYGTLYCILYGTFSGYRINWYKSELMPIQFTDDEWLKRLPFKISTEKFSYLGIVITKKFEALFNANFTHLNWQTQKPCGLLENTTNLPIRPSECCQDGLPSPTSLSPAEHTNIYN